MLFSSITEGIGYSQDDILYLEEFTKLVEIKNCEEEIQIGLPEIQKDMIQLKIGKEKKKKKIGKGRIKNRV